MMILHLDSSIQGTASASRTLSATVIKRLLEMSGDASVVHRDLVTAPIDHLTLPALAEAEAVTVLDEFLAADTVVIGAALYNFTIPSQLKAWIDRILVAGRTFAYGADGPVGLVPNKRVIIALARGGLYGEGSPFAHLEHAETLLRGTFAFMGVRDIEFIIAEGLALGEESRRASVERAIEVARQLPAAWTVG